MINGFFDILVAKEYETNQDGVVTKKTAWNKVGRAWLSKSSESLSFEMFHQPNQRFVINVKSSASDQ